ncbi:MAG: hypothetical protein PF495_18485 [Spirochaetales bacterium]|nr:hypothetical protein [Spirochaetales bacterium]
MSLPLFMLVTLFGVQGDVTLENTSIAGYQEEYHTGIYNRLRGEASFELVQQPAFFATLIVDNNTSYKANPDSLVNRTSIYRGYVGYGGARSRVILGKQRVPLGVGRIWNPIDIFNPVNAEAIEVAERPGTECGRLEWQLGNLANFDMTLAKDKGEMRLKSYFSGADVALVALSDHDTKLDIIGWELEGELLATGLELRSEGGHFYDRIRHESYFAAIVGAEYGFQNSLNILCEYKYNDETKLDYLGSIISYQPGMLWHLALLGLLNVDDDSYFLVPSVEYSLADDMTLSAGCFLYEGDRASEYGLLPNRYFAMFFVYF